MAACHHLTPEFVKDNFHNTLIYKDECMRCYNNPEGENGINLCLKTLQGFCTDEGHSQQHFEKTGNPIVLNIKKIPKLVDGEPQKITKLAIGKEGGGGIDDPFDTVTSLHCLAWNIELDKTGAFIAPIIDSILLSKSAFFESQVGEWEQDIKECECVKNLDQSECQKIASKSLASCGEWDLKANLWLCMICGHLGCGRQQYGGLDGNSHAIAHFESTSHPVVCKMGTITPQGTASLYCYKCNDDIFDSKLGEHLQNLGIDMGLQTKTEKTLTEINLELNLSLTLSKAVEEGRVLTPIFGPGNTGMINLGNSCYLNSVIQVLFSYDRIGNHFYNMYEDHHKVWDKLTTECYDCQLSKLAHGLKSGKYSERKEQPVPQHDQQTEEEKKQMEVYQDGIRPQSFKNLIGKGHEEFSSGRQQDSQEYLQYFMEVIEKEEVKRGRENPCQMFNFDLEHRYECQACKGVAYIPEKTNQLNLLIMKDSDEEMIPEEEEMKNGLERFLSDEAIEKDCPGCSGKQTFLRRTRFLNFPEVMIVVAQRFTFQNWTPTKINTSLKVILDDLDLTPYKVSGGVQEGETALPDGGEVEVEVDVEINQDQLNQCLMMGLPELAAKHALHSTGNSGADAAVTWYFSNMENPVINGPLPKEKKMVKQGGFAAPVEEKKVEEAVSVDEGSFSMLAGMGMDPERSRKALIKFNNNLEQALDYITSHGPEEDEFEEEKQDAPEAKEWIVDPRPGVYDLNAFITHLGNSIHSGHYVAHIKKGEDWVLYNDNKVVITSDPPHDKAFVYFYKKKD